MIRAGALRVTTVLLDGRNRYPINIRLTQTRKRNDRKRLAVMQENAAIIREGRNALLKRLAREREQNVAATAAAAVNSTATPNSTITTPSTATSSTPYSAVNTTLPPTTSQPATPPSTSP